jgi:uncharacterized protein affecting Mg2+/Co2+ transport
MTTQGGAAMSDDGYLDWLDWMIGESGTQWQTSPGEYEEVLGLLKKMFCFVAAAANYWKEVACKNQNKQLLEAIDLIFDSDRNRLGMTTPSTLKDGLTNCRRLVEPFALAAHTKEGTNIAAMVNVIWDSVRPKSDYLERHGWLISIRQSARLLLRSSDVGPNLSTLHPAAHSDLNRYRRTSTRITTAILDVVNILIGIISPISPNQNMTAEQLIDQEMAFLTGSLQGDKDVERGTIEENQLTWSELTCSDVVSDGVRVIVKSMYLGWDRADEAIGKYAFAYKIRITNEKKQPIKLLSRRLEIQMVKSANKRVELGPGVSGELPILQPLECHEYITVITHSVKGHTPAKGSLIARMQGEYVFVEEKTLTTTAPPLRARALQKGQVGCVPLHSAGAPRNVVNEASHRNSLHPGTLLRFL